MAHLFANYWPVLLIFWGVIKLIEHSGRSAKALALPASARAECSWSS